jgi:transcriptional regulator with XRE-family HTH domain
LQAQLASHLAFAASLETPGQRIARARRRRGLSQAVLAGLVGRSESWLSQVERGRRGIDSHAVLTRLAEVLRIDIEQITTPGADAEDAQHAYPAAALIEQAMMRYGTLGASDGPEPEPGRQMGHLRAMARSAYQHYHATRYEATGHLRG